MDKLNLNLNDLDLGELQAMTEESTYALPEAGASVGYNSCSKAADAEIEAN